MKLGDFAELKSLFQVNDYFEEDGRSFTVLRISNRADTERIYAEKWKVFVEKELISKMIPVLKDLAYMENAGVKNLAVSVENVYRKKDGSFCILPDLGKTVPQGMSLSYQICEILYECFTDQQPACVGSTFPV